jgi:choline-sulfatase
MKALVYHPPYKTFGRPLTPEILEAIGIVNDCDLTKEDGGTVRRFDFWTTTSRRDILYRQGGISLNASRSGRERRLEVTELREGEQSGEQRAHGIEAVMQCAPNALWSPRTWSYTSWMRTATGRVDPQTVLTERGSCRRRLLVRNLNGHVETERLPGTGLIAGHWGLWEAVRHLPRERGFDLGFGCLEHLRKFKPDHHLGFQGGFRAELAGRKLWCFRFVQHGFGILPTEYLLDETGRLLFVIDANRVAVSAALRREPRLTPRWRRPRLPAPAVTTGRKSRGAARPPNILFIISDQLHWRAFSAAGNRHLATPAIDSLCRRGVRFDNAYCTNPICAPSRSSMFSGRMPSETGVNRLSHTARLRSGLPTAGEWLTARAGYESVYAGKWHVGPCHTYDIPGFRVLCCGQDHRGDISDVTVSHACEAYLRNRRGRDPFLLVASITQPHDVCDWLRLNQLHKRVPPFDLPGLKLPPLPENFRAEPKEPAYLPRYRTEQCEPNVGRWTTAEWRWYLWNYYRMVEMADAEMARILHALEASGQADNTLIVFTSDHGEGVGEHRLDRKNFHYEAVVRVPLVCALPGRIPAGKVNRRALVSGIDLMPTFCDFAGVAPPPLTTATSLHPVLAQGRNATRTGVAVEMSVRTVGRVWRSARFKYAAINEDPVEQLFDLTRDPGETRNLAGHPAFRRVLEEHRSALAAWEQALDRAPDSPVFNPSNAGGV